MGSLDRFLAYPRSLADISARAQGVGMGHWKITVNTRVGSFLLDTANHRFEVPVDYPEARQAVYAIRDAIEDDFEAVWPAISALQAWIDDGLASLGPAVAAAGSDGTYDDALARATTARDLVAATATALRKAASKHPDHVESVRSLHGTITDESMRRCSELHRALADQPGGHHDALAQFSVLQSILATSQATLTEAAHDLVSETTAVLAELDAISGEAEQLIKDLERCRQLVNGGVDNQLVRSTLDLEAMSATWNALAASTATVAAGLLRTPLRPASLRARATARRT